MEVREFVQALRILSPRFREVEGCCLVEVSGIFPESEAFRASLDSLFEGDAKRAERETNRCYVVSNILDNVVEDGNWTDEDLLLIAETYARLLRGSLCVEFPDREFEVEILGRNMVDLEPLELCVTFSRAV